MHSTRKPRFVADATLGRLSKWLRLAGFDTLYLNHTPDAHALAEYSKRPTRVILTRTINVWRKLPPGRTLFISENDPMDQIRLVLREMGLQREDLRPLTRCVRCNCLLQETEKKALNGRVPDYIWQKHEYYRKCPQCSRLYWAGSHSAHWTALIDSWFDSEP